MGLLFRLSLVITISMLILYCGSFYIMPSVTIENSSSVDIASAQVGLPRSNLDFGTINAQKHSTIHYFLQQDIGVYRYRIIFHNGEEKIGQCGSVLNNEFHKRVVLQVSLENVSCSDNLL